MLNGQSCVDWSKEGIELIIINKKGEAVELSRYNTLCGHTIQISDYLTFEDSFDAAMSVVRGKYLTILDSGSSLSSLSSMFDIVKELKLSEANLMFKVSRVSSSLECIPTLTGKIMLTEWFKNLPISLKSSPSGMHMYYMAKIVDCYVEEFDFCPQETFLICSDLNRHPEGEMQTSMYTTTIKLYKVKQDYLNILSDLCKSYWQSSIDSSPIDKAKNRIQLKLFISKLTSMSPQLLSEYLPVYDDMDEDTLEKLHSYIKKVIGE